MRPASIAKTSLQTSSRSGSAPARAGTTAGDVSASQRSIAIFQSA